MLLYGFLWISRIEKKMNSSQIAMAQKLAREWKPKR